MKKKAYPLERADLSKSLVLVCGGLNFDPSTNQVWSNKGKGAIFIRKDSHYRRLLYALMMSQNKLFTYDELFGVLFTGSNRNLPNGTTREKYINDKVDALKKKLLLLDFERKELKQMFRCDGGYQLVRPKVGRKIGTTKRLD